MSEQSVIGIANRYFDQDSFVITKAPTSNKPFEFCVHGYYFKVKELKYITQLFNTDDVDLISIYASINIDTQNELYELSGQDDADTLTYSGVNFTSVKPINDDYSIEIIKGVKINNSIQWSIPVESYIKFNNDSLNISIIDGGII